MKNPTDIGFRHAAFYSLISVFSFVFMMIEATIFDISSTSFSNSFNSVAFSFQIVSSS